MSGSRLACGFGLLVALSGCSNVEPDSAPAQAWLKGVPVSFPILFDRENTVAAAFGVEGMPSTVFIDRSGAVRYVHRGYKPGDESKYSDMIRSLVKE